MLRHGVIVIKSDTLEQILLSEFLKNHKNYQDSPSKYIIPSNICDKYSIAPSTLSYRLDKMKEEGLIKVHSTKTEKARKTLCDSRKIYIPTKQGVDHGGLGREFEEITEGPNDSTSHLNSSVSLADLHGDLSISFQVNDLPENDTITWKKVNELKNGVTHKMRTIFKAGDRISVELYEGTKTSKIVLKPRLLAGQQDTPESLLKAFRDAAYEIRSYLIEKGYSLGMGEEKGEGKFTIRSKTLEGIGYLEGENTLFDRSQGMTELHPRTGDVESNKIMSELLTNYQANQQKLEYLNQEDIVNTLDGMGEIAKMVNSVNDFNKKIEPVMKEQAEIKKNQKVIAQSVKQLADDFNKLMNMVQDGEEQPDYSPPDTDPGGHIYG
jgi:DNA-binding Lrp family transcriptional regulator